MMRNTKILSAAGLLTLALASAAPAAAADLGPLPPAPGLQSPEPLVEWGTGWYLRGDIAADQSISAPVSALETRKRDRLSAAYSFGVGYKISDNLRLDATYDQFTMQSRSGSYGKAGCPSTATPVLDASGAPVGFGWTGEQCSKDASSKLGVRGGLVNVYYDFGKFGMFTPYVGGGLGLFETRAKAKAQYTTATGVAYSADLTPAAGVPQVWVDPATGVPLATQPNVAFTQHNWSRSDKRTRYGLGWALMAGVGVDLADGLKLDLGYRFVDAGKVTSFADPHTGVTKSTRLQNHQVRVGLRYQID